MADQKRDELFAAAAAGDEYAFRQIIAQHQKDMYRVCMSIAGDRAVAEDATQAAWLIAWKKHAATPDPTSTTVPELLPGVDLVTEEVEPGV